MTLGMHELANQVLKQQDLNASSCTFKKFVCLYNDDLGTACMYK
jgi:hypothetical protein